MTTRHPNESNAHAQTETTEVKATGNGHATPAAHATATVKDGIASRLAELNNIEADIVILVKSTVADALRTGGGAAGHLTKVIHDVVDGVILATEQVGTGLTVSTKSVAKGIVMGVHEVGGDIVTAAAETVRSVIRHASAVGADLGLIARRAVNGVIEGVAETGGSVAQVGKHATEGAIEEAGKISNMAVKTVKEVLIGIGDSVSEVVASVRHSSSHHAAQRPAAPEPEKTLHS